MKASQMATELANLKEREQVARDAEVRLKTQLESVQAELEKACKEAREKFGTDDLAELRTMYSKALDEDQKAIEAFRESIELREKLIETIQATANSMRFDS